MRGHKGDCIQRNGLGRTLCACAAMDSYEINADFLNSPDKIDCLSILDNQACVFEVSYETETIP
jgi:hypothetical protein